MAATPNRQFKNIYVLSGFTYGKHKEFVETAIDLGRSIAVRKLHLVYGGGNRGLSKMVSEAAFIRGSQVLGIIPRVLKPLGSSSDSSTGEELVISGMQERITEMLNHADAFIFLPGDLATLEALITLASWAHLHIHQKPIDWGSGEDCGSEGWWRVDKRKGLPVTARLTLLDTRFKEYQDAVIGTVLTTLHAGSVLLTFYPNFNLSLHDPNLPITLKVQIQIQESIPSIVQIPRQIQKQELLKLMSLKWLSNYEKFHQNSQSVQTTDAHFKKRADGTIKLTFQSPSTSQTPIVPHPPSEQSTPRNSFSYSSMITAVSTVQENLPIHGFASDGYLIYPNKINSHFLWDVPRSHMCDPDCPCLKEEDDDFNRRPRRRKKKSHKMDPYHKKLHLPPNDPDSLMPLPIYRKGLRLIQKEYKQRSYRKETTLSSSPTMHVQLCMMFSSNSYQEQFPHLEKQIDPQTKVSTKPFVHSPVTPNGQLEEPKPFEAVLNWQTQNVRAQKSAFRSLDEKNRESCFLSQANRHKVFRRRVRPSHLWLPLLLHLLLLFLLLFLCPDLALLIPKREGYTHLRLGGIGLILTLHGRKGLPVTALLAMLDTRFKQCQDAVISTVLTTLHAGSVLLTFYPNFILSLQDPNLPTTLKVQVQIQGAEQISSAKIATLHYQLVYQLQNHALDLPTPEHHFDTLMVLAESDQIPTIIQIPRQIPHHELIKLIPLEWISNYEQFHNNTAPIQTSESMFERRQDGTVRMTFKPPPSAPQEPPRLSFTYSLMITAVQTAQEDLPITGFNSTDDDDYATTRKKKGKKKKSPVSCHSYDPKPPHDPPPPPAPLPFYKKELQWIAQHCKSETPSPIPLPTPPLACMMFLSTSSYYSSSFSPLEPHTDSQRKVVSKPFVPSLITSSGHLEPPKPFESVLNWQTQNARAHNDTLLNINSKVEKISLRTEQLETKVDSIAAQMQQIHHNLQSKIAQLDSELRTMLAQRYYGPEFDQKERKIIRLKAELDQIESEKQRPTLFTTSPPIPSINPTYHPFASMLSPIRQYDPSKLFGMTHTLFRDNPLPLPPKPKPKPKPQPRPVTIHQSSISIPAQQSPGSTPASPPAPPSAPLSQPPTQSKDKEPMHQFSAHTVDHSSTTDHQTSDSNLTVSASHTETDTDSSESTSDSEKSYADITRILMAQPDQPPQGQTSHTKPSVNIPSDIEEEMPESSATNQPPPTQAQIENDELEFYFSEQDEPNDETMFALQDSSDNSDSDQSQMIFHQQLLSLDTTVPIPSIKLQILPSKFQRPVPAIGLIDTGAQRRSHEEHRQLLTQFYDIVQSHEIMLSAKKSTIATDNIEFLGMIITYGHYQPGKHIAQELLHFPDQQLSKKQVQQFLGIINYIRDFILHVDHYTRHFSALLKKKPPEWNADHTTAVTTLKQIAQNPPPLKLITNGKHILQTDASDESWGAILLEEINGKEHFIAYASGQFSNTQKHYHSVFKEILAGKNGIKKFEYHLIGHHFLIRMDNSAFPNILNFKAVIDNEIQSNLHNYLYQLNHQTPPHKDIFHTSLGPQHDLIMIPTPSAISKPKSTCIIIKEEKSDYTNFLYQDSQDPWEEFLPLSQHLQQFLQPSINEPGSSSQPSKVDKATQMPSPKSSPSKPGCRKDSPYPLYRGPHHKHP
ncbi:hypothetical protein KPL70_017265 [Citrus sinensis]|nr:hypothetical protein KPL70_017265 [Citrus sinensis]